MTSQTEKQKMRYKYCPMCKQSGNDIWSVNII